MPIVYKAIDVPVLVKHATLAIMAKPMKAFRKRHPLIPPSTNVGTERFLQAFITAVNGLRQQGYLTGASRAGPGHVITLTGKGQTRERIHLYEGSGKGAWFDSLFNAAFARTEPEKGSKDQKQLKDPRPADNVRKPPPPKEKKKPKGKEDPFAKSKPKKATSDKIQKRSSAKMPKAAKVKRKRPPKGRV